MRSKESIARIKNNVAMFKARIQAIYNDEIGEDDDVETRWALPMADVMAMSDGEYRDVVDRLEDSNMHPECVVFDAKRSGNHEFVTEAEALLAEQMSAGELTMALYERRRKLCAALKEDV
jgi:hypothetical protein